MFSMCFWNWFPVLLLNNSRQYSNIFWLQLLPRISNYIVRYRWQYCGWTTALPMCSWEFQRFLYASWPTRLCLTSLSPSVVEFTWSSTHGIPDVQLLVRLFSKPRKKHAVILSFMAPVFAPAVLDYTECVLDHFISTWGLWLVLKNYW
jgi:hypothetical protein